MAPRDLLTSDDEGESPGPSLRVNPKYAERFEKRKKREELTRLHEAGRTLEDDEEEEEEDSDGELLTPAIDSQIVRTIAAIRAGDARVYDPETRWFTPDGVVKTAKSTPKAKPKRLKDLVREEVLARMDGGGSESDVEVDQGGLPYDEEQRRLKAAFLTTLDDSAGGHELLQARAKTDEERAADDVEYEAFLRSQLAADSGGGAALLRFWDSGDNLDEGEQFLRDYVLHRGWVDMEGKDRVPTYSEVVEAELSDDEAALDAMDDFEREYNFRHEEPGAAVIASHPRADPDTLRRDTSTRKAQRERRKQRKTDDRRRREAEVKRLKNLKLEEMSDRLDRIRDVAGVTAEPGALDLDSGFDPDAHDAAMARVFGDAYYEDADQPPEDAEFAVDVDDDDDGDDDGEVVEEEGRGKRRRHGRRLAGFKRVRRRKLESVVHGAEAEAEAGDAVFRDYLDEYYHLHHEDMIDGLPTRFRYRAVPADDYGLSAEDLLTLPDAALSQYVPLKKLAPYRDRGYRASKRRLRRLLQERGDEERRGRRRKYAGAGEEVEGGVAPAQPRMTDRGVTAARLDAYRSDAKKKKK